MSKFSKVMVALLAIAAFAAPSFAEDRLSLSGEMRVRGWFTSTNSNDSQTWGDQRFRLAAKIAVAEGLTLNLRTDISEQQWGTDPGNGRKDSLQWDRVYLDWKGDAGRLIAGQMNMNFGHATVDSQDTGFMYTTPGAIPVTLFFQVVDDNEANVKAGTQQDAILYGANVALGNDTFKSNIILASQNGGYDAAAATTNYYALGQESEVYLIGATFATTAGPVKIDSEIDFFTGDYDDNTDVIGLQGQIDASMSVTDTVMIGGAFYYAMAADAADEHQVTYLGNAFNGTDLLNWGPLTGEELLNETRSIYDFTDTGAGVISAKIYTDIKATDATLIQASAAYATTEDNDVYDEEGFVYNLGVSQTLTDNVSVVAQMQYGNWDTRDEDFSAGTALFVKF